MNVILNCLLFFIHRHFEICISAIEVIPMSGNCNVFKLHTVVCALLCFHYCSSGNHNRCGLAAWALKVTEVMIPRILLCN
jgi:hypothetical protein